MPLSKISNNVISDNTITNAKINSSAAIAKAKLASLDIVNADINGSAAIAKAKLASLDIVNADVNASAAIARTKFAAPICVFANSTTNNGGFAAGAWEAVEFANEIIDTNSAFSGQEGTDANNGGVFTCPVTGRYQIHAGTVAEGGAGGMGTLGLRLVKNTTGNASNGGTQIDGTESNFVATSGNITVVSGNVLAIADLAVGNKVWLQAYANWHSGSWVAGAGHFSVMQIA